MHNDDPTEPELSKSELERAARKRKLDQIFGDVLPDLTQDERTSGNTGSTDSSRDEELRRHVPPHHGG